MMLKENLNLDQKDLKIVSMFVRNPDVSQAELAESLKISQPSVNVRVHKLKKRGILCHSVGIEFNMTNMYMARVDFTAIHADKILNALKACSFFVNGFIMSGTNNASMMVVGFNLKKIENIVNKHLRTNPDVKDINMNVMVSSAKPFICGIDIENECPGDHNDSSACSECKIKI